MGSEPPSYYSSEQESCESPRYERRQRKEKRAKDKGGAIADTNYWPVYRFCLRNYPLVRLANGLAADAKRGRLNAGRNHQSRPRYVSLMNITYDFHGALSRVGTLPADVKAGKEPPVDYSRESTATSLSLLPSLPSLHRYLIDITRYQQYQLNYVQYIMIIQIPI